MTLILGLALGGAALLALLWLPAYPPARHPHMKAMDVLARPVPPRPRARCEWCDAELDALGMCTGSCAGEVWDR